MRAEKPNRYRIGLGNREIKSIEIDGQKVQGFKHHDNDGKVWKMYMVKSGEEVAYIGATTQGIRNRLRSGLLKVEGKGVYHGYHGYKWQDLSEVEILIWCLPTESRDTVKALEAELVYLFRHHLGKWPKYQMEIHFHSDVTKDVTMTAKELFNSIERGHYW